MAEYAPHEIRVIYRASHSVLWELADKAGILDQLGLSLQSLEPANTSTIAEGALYRGEIDFISGNHLAPYGSLAKGRPIVCIASPGNSIRSRVVTRVPVTALSDFKSKGLRIADSNFIGLGGILHHSRGNHVIDVLRAGYDLEEPEWVELGEQEDPETRTRVIDAVRTGKADIGFTRGSPDLEREGFHLLDLPVLPMINGTTITTTYEALGKKEGLADRLIRAEVLTIHLARTRPEEAQRLLDTKLGRPYAEHGGRASAISRYPMKPYPTTEGVANVYELACLHNEEAKSINPLALWDMHYLRTLDQSGFIDELLQEQPENVRNQGDEPTPW